MLKKKQKTNQNIYSPTLWTEHSEGYRIVFQIILYFRVYSLLFLSVDPDILSTLFLLLVYFNQLFGSIV